VTTSSKLKARASSAASACSTPPCLAKRDSLRDVPADEENQDPSRSHTYTNYEA
jgi:hypothetical protein